MQIPEVSSSDSYELDQGVVRPQGEKAVVTGGGSGIGSAIASGSAEFGVDVALIDLNVDHMNAVKDELERRFPVRILSVPADLCNIKQIEDAVNGILAELGRVDILVNRHRIGQWSGAAEMTNEDWDRMIDVNLKGVFFMCRAAGRRMIGRRYGKLINVASMSGSIVNTPQSHYNSSKAGVIVLTNSRVGEVYINVNSVSPGYTLTPLVERLLQEQPEYAGYWKPLIPLGRLAKPIDIVGAVIFLSTDAASYITGHNLSVDCGYTVW